MNPGSEGAAETSLLNLETLLVNAKPLGEVQGRNGTIFEYRFEKGDQVIIIVWRSIEGDTAAPVTLANLEVRSLKAFPVDAASFDLSGGTEINVDENGNALMLVNERPVVLIGKTASLTVGIEQNVQNTIELVQIEFGQSMRRLANNQKSSFEAMGRLTV